MNHSEDDDYQDGIRLPHRDEKDALNRHITACSLLGEAQGMLNSLILHMNFQDELHQGHVEQCIERWADKVDKFVEGGYE